jgi:hypothetical protein
MRRRTIEWIVAIVVFAVAGLPALGQGARIDISSIDYSATAEETVEVTLDGPVLRMAAKFMRSESPGDREIAEMIEKLEGIYVKSFSFAEPGMWTSGDVEAIKAQIGPLWQRIVNVKSRDGENVEIYFLPQGEQLAGIVIVATEDDELTVVNLVGPVDLDKLSRLENQFGIPAMGLDQQETKKAGK